ncbi:uncharacterized protein EDB91DRAFT_1240289 [Suillus paluster]|uniref:uncharacterized protein n=1 Tax=Suillus paluster TaxID=48578 RepID=UPI001B87887D|nr:uncharacterized protein EDB91DRAFT_1240289 [Suillus paluster]KAG1721691.1 hypothetical protein EDB91DRAFT_1240289 [Suillus paluster]
MNEIPIRLIRLSDMTLVGRNDVRQHFRSSVPGVTVLYHAPHHVKYAILSHRLTYGEMKAGTAAGPGYEKLKSFCEKAREYQTEFAWSDTCCIDKSSSTELDESIRSMFRWYKNLTICIVHMAESVIIEDILHDEWINEGLDAAGTPCRATGIPVDDLHELLPGPFRVDERMTWAARCKTTRPADSRMEKEEISAFCRLIEAIMHAGNPSVLNWKGEAAKHHFSDAIPRSPQSFVGSQGSEFGGGRLEMTMTSLGLRVALVMLPLTFHLEEFVGVSDVRITLDCPLCPTVKTDITTDHN